MCCGFVAYKLEGRVAGTCVYVCTHKRRCQIVFQNVIYRFILSSTVEFQLTAPWPTSDFVVVKDTRALFSSQSLLEEPQN